MIDEKMRSKVLKALPHGSGLDAEWVEEDDNYQADSARFYGGFHYMNSDGFYDGWVDVWVEYFEHQTTLEVSLRGPLEGKVQVLHRPGDRDIKVTMANVSMDPREYEVEARELRAYLEELVYQTLKDQNLIDVRDEVVDAKGE